MAGSEQSTDPDRNAETFRVYVSTNIDLADIPEKLRCEFTEDDDDAYDVQNAQGLTTQQICQRHREDVSSGGRLYTTLFLVIDSHDLSDRGVLAVNLDPYHGYPDALRQLPDEAGNLVASLSIANSDWYECRESVGEKSALLPENWFALYDLLPSSQDEEFDLAVKALNDGLQEVKVDSDSDDSEEEVDEDSLGLSRKYHRGVRPESRDLAGLVENHASFAGTQNLDPSYFAVIDDRYKGEGALIVRVGPSEDSFRCKNPIAGEILGWIFINFMTWDEARDFARRQ